MKVKYVMTVTTLKDIKMEDFKHADDEDDAAEQVLAGLQDDLGEQHQLLEEADLVEVIAIKLIVQ